MNDISLKTYRRYVDDSHARFESKECTMKFLKVLNQKDPQIQYTIEEQSEADQLSFLDVNVINIIFVINKMVDMNLKYIEKRPLQMYKLKNHRVAILS